jgi:hypothetical protein
MRPREFDDNPPPNGTPNFLIAVDVFLLYLVPTAQSLVSA